MILEQLFKLMAEKKASDIYISAGTAVHIKIQGLVMPVNQQILDAATIKQMAYELMNKEQIAQFEQNLEMNLSFSRTGLGNYRINLFHQRSSIALAIRYITGDIPNLPSLGLPQTLADVVMEKRGLILVVGATGSGKSTTLAAMIDHRNANKSGHILTLEDPIEYLFKHKKSVVNQREVGVDTLSYTVALKNALRQAPDCILVGEIRDRETMGLVLSYAQSGHLCLATLHATNSYYAMNRIISFYSLENRPALLLELSLTLKCVVSQRLIRDKQNRLLPTVEVLLNTAHISELIERGEISRIKEAMEQSLAPGSQTFEQDLLRLYKSGHITLEEALANADSPTNLNWLIINSEGGANARSVVAEKAEPSKDKVSYTDISLNRKDETEEFS